MKLIHKKALYFFLILIQIAFGQSNRYPDVDKYLDNYIFNVNDPSGNNRVDIFDRNLVFDYENEIIKTKDTEKILDFYNKLAFRISLTSDMESAKIYTEKIKKILSVYKSKRQLGFYYFTFGYMNHFRNTPKQRLEYYSKSAELIEKYGTENEMLQVSFILSKTLTDLKQYDKSLKYCNLINKIVNKTPEFEIETTNNYVTLFENYLNLNQLDSAKVYMNKLLNQKQGISKHIESRIYNLRANYMMRNNNIKLANQYSMKSDSLAKVSYRVERLKLIDTNSKNIKLRNQEIESNKKYNQKIILIIVLSFCIFCILLYLFFKIKTNKQLVKKTIELDILNKKLSGSIESKNFFIDTITHEIKTPINTIKSISYLFELNSNLVTTKEFIETLNFSSDYLNNLINNFVQYNVSQNKVENISLNLNNIELKKLLDQIINFYILEKKNNNNYVLNFDTKIGFNILVDDIKLTQILVNLLNNSTKFTHNGIVEITVKLIEHQNDIAKIYFEIKDNGIGIEKGMVKDIFEPFVQESKEINYSFGGVGLGLSIVKTYIELMNGTVELKTEKNKGTQIFFTIQCQTKIIKDENPKINSEFKPKRILLVEDNQINQALTKKIITNCGHTCDVANNGREAVEMVANNSYDIVFMDIMMPIMNGYEALVVIKNTNPNLPIIALTSLVENINQEQYNVKFDRFLIKPTPPNKINEMIAYF